MLLFIQKDIQNTITYSIFNAILSALCTIIISFILNNIYIEKVILRISNTTKINDTQYGFNIDISNFEKNIDSLTISIPSKLNLSKINTDNYAHIEQVHYKNNNKIKIKYTKNQTNPILNVITYTLIIWVVCFIFISYQNYSNNKKLNM